MKVMSPGQLQIPLLVHHVGDHMIKETDQSEGSGSDDEEVTNQSVHFALQDKHSGCICCLVKTRDHVMHE